MTTKQVRDKKQTKAGFIHSSITKMLSPRRRKATKTEKLVSGLSYDDVNKYRDQIKQDNAKLEFMFSNDLSFNINVVSSKEKEEKTMSRSRFFKGFDTGILTTAVAGGAIGYATGAITINNAAIVFAGSVGLGAAAPWLAVGLVGAALAYYYYQHQHRQAASSEADFIAETDKPDSNNRFFKGFATGAATTIAAGGAIGYAAGIITIKNTAILFAGSISLTSVAPWLALAAVAFYLYYFYGRSRSTTEVIREQDKDMHKLEDDEGDGNYNGPGFGQREGRCSIL